MEEIFRRQAVDYQRNRLAGEFLKIKPLSNLSILVFFLVVLLVTVAAVSLIKLPVSFHVNAIVVERSFRLDQLSVGSKEIQYSELKEVSGGNLILYLSDSQLEKLQPHVGGYISIRYEGNYAQFLLGGLYTLHQSESDMRYVALIALPASDTHLVPKEISVEIVLGYSDLWGTISPFSR